MAKSGYDFYLDKCLLPVPPEKLTVKINNHNKLVTLINEGPVNLLKTAKLSDIEFDCLIPQVKYPFAVYKSGFQDAAYFLDCFEKLKTGKKPFPFIVTRMTPGGRVLFSTDMKVSMEDYVITEQADNGFDLTVRIKLKQYRDFGTKILQLQKQSSGVTASIQQNRPAETSPAPASTQSYTVQTGDCLWNIAKKFYDDGSRYTDIYAANQDIIGANPNLVYAGQVLMIPPK